MAKRCGQPRANGKSCRYFLNAQGLCPYHDGAGHQVASRQRRRFWPWLFLAAIAWFIFSEDDGRPEIDASLHNDVQQAIAHFRQDPDKTIAELKQIIERETARENPDQEQLSWLWQQLAAQHERRWHWHLALQAWYQAARYQDDDLQRLHRSKLERHFRDMQVERNFQQRYVANRDAGPARTLTKTVLIANVFVDLTGDEHWGNKERLLALQAQQHMRDWLLTRQHRYRDAELHFVSQTFSAQSSEFTGFHKAYRGRAILASLIHGEENDGLKKLYASILQRDDIDQVALMLHYPKTDRSFAFRCFYHQRPDKKPPAKPLSLHRCDDELAVITHKLEHNNWPRVAVTQTHELLHLFGAADLYNIRDAATFATTDIMHYAYPRLQDTDIQPLTAWAIGWLDEMPETPFPIEDQ